MVEIGKRFLRSGPPPTKHCQRDLRDSDSALHLFDPQAASVAGQRICVKPSFRLAFKRRRPVGS